MTTPTFDEINRAAIKRHQEAAKPEQKPERKPRKPAEKKEAE